MKVWIYIGNSQQGPFTLDELSKINITAETPVWYDGLEQWMPAGEAPATCHLFADGYQSVDNHDVESTVEPQQDIKPEHAEFVGSPGLRRVATAKTYLGWSIVLNICCCLSPFSIAALVGSIITIIRNNQGDESGARAASNVTQWLIIIAIALGVPMMFIYSLLSAI
jgi:hypothetical protein